LQTNDCLAAHPVTARVKRVAGNDKHISAVAGDAARPLTVEGLLISTPTTQP
jgi:hypothetical protein